MTMKVLRALAAAVLSSMLLAGCVSTQPVSAEVILAAPVDITLPLRPGWLTPDTALCIELVEHPYWRHDVPDGVLRTADGTLVHLNMKVVHENGRTTTRNPGGPITEGTTNVCWLPVNDPYTDTRSVTLSSDHPVPLRRIWWYHYHGE